MALLDMWLTFLFSSSGPDIVKLTSLTRARFFPSFFWICFMNMSFSFNLVLVLCTFCSFWVILGWWSVFSSSIGGILFTECTLSYLGAPQSCRSLLSPDVKKRSFYRFFTESTLGAISAGRYSLGGFNCKFGWKSSMNLSKCWFFYNNCTESVTSDIFLSRLPWRESRIILFFWGFLIGFWWSRLLRFRYSMEL